MKHPVFFFFFRLVRNWTNSCWFGWIQNHRFWLKPPIHVEIRKKKKGCKMHHFGWNNKTLTNLTRFILLIFSSLTRLCALCLCSPSPLSHTQPLSHTHNLTLNSLSHSHNLTHNLTNQLSISSSQLKSQLSSLTHSQKSQLRYQTKAFNLSFSIFLSSSWSYFFSLKLTSPDLIFFNFLYKL